MLKKIYFVFMVLFIFSMVSATENPVEKLKSIKGSDLTGDIETIDEIALNELGLKIYKDVLFFDELSITFKATEKLNKLLNEGTSIEINFTIIDGGVERVIQLPLHSILGQTFITSENYVHRLAVIPKLDFKWLKKGTVYTFDLKLNNE